MKSFYEMMRILESYPSPIGDPEGYRAFDREMRGEEDDLPDTTAREYGTAEKEFPIVLAPTSPVTFKDATNGIALPYMPGSEVVVGGHNDEYLIHIRVGAVADLDIETGNNASWHEIEPDTIFITNKTSGKEFPVPDEMDDKIVGDIDKTENTPYVAGIEPHRGDLNAFVMPRRN